MPLRQQCHSSRVTLWSMTLLTAICAYIKALLGHRDPILLAHPEPDSSMNTLHYWLAKLVCTGLYTILS